MDFALLGNAIIEFPECRTRLNPSCFLFEVDVHRTEVDQVNKDKWGFAAIGQAFIVVASTPNPDPQAVSSGAKYGCLDFGFVERRDDEEGLQS